MLRVLIADDHPVFRRGLKQIIDDTSDMFVAGEATDGREALRKATTCDYDVVLLDISMPLKNGLDVLSQLKAARPALPVLMLSMHPEEQYAVRALKTGASGYLTKESAPEEMLSAIRKVSKGGKYVSASLAETLASMLNDDDERLPHEALSNREYQVMLLDRLREVGLGDRAGAVAQREDRQHLSRAHSREAQNDEQRRNHPLRDQERTRGLESHRSPYPRSSRCRTNTDDRAADVLHKDRSSADFPVHALGVGYESVCPLVKRPGLMVAPVRKGSLMRRLWILILALLFVVLRWHRDCAGC